MIEMKLYQKLKIRNEIQNKRNPKLQKSNSTHIGKMQCSE